MNDPRPPFGSDRHKKYRGLEWLFSILAVINCILVVITFSTFNISFSTEGILSQWPFPIIYFIEIVSLSIIGLVAVGKLNGDVKSNWSGVPWICSGILLAFVILGAWTIGFFLLPAMILFLIIGILADKRTQGDIPLHLIYFVAAGIAQAVIVFLSLFG
ncbi:MAG TPA: hypothetical protein VMW34_04650 [Anaerolineales bacterium]|nr:hypothetical protein [Anaerolineales bacterium]